MSGVFAVREGRQVCLHKYKLLQQNNKLECDDEVEGSKWGFGRKQVALEEGLELPLPKVCHLGVQFQQAWLQPIECTRNLPCDRADSVTIAPHIRILDDDLLAAGGEPDGVQGHGQGVHAVGADIARLLVEAGGGVGEALVLPVPVAVLHRFVEALEFPVAALLPQVQLLRFTLASGQAPHALHLRLEICTRLCKGLLAVFVLGSVYQSHEDACHEPAALRSLHPVVSGQALQGRQCNCLFWLVGKGDWERGQPHERAVPVVKLVFFGGVGLLVVHELVHRY